MYLLDTNICAYLMKNSFPSLSKRILSLKTDQLAISSITLYEIEYGAYKAGWGERRMQDLYLFLSAFQIIPFSAEDAHVAARIRAELVTVGKPIGVYDIQIAAQAVARGLTVITHNINEFKRVPGLKVEDWV